MTDWEVEMAGLITLCGTILGFVSAVVGFFVFDISFVAAFAIWALSGPVSAAIAMLAPAQPPAAKAHATAQRGAALSGNRAEPA